MAGKQLVETRRVPPSSRGGTALMPLRGFGAGTIVTGKNAGHSISHISVLAPQAKLTANGLIIQRDPVPGSPPPVANGRTDADTKQRIEAALQQSTQGREALQISQTLKIQIEYQANGPNQYRPDTNVCLINSSLPPSDAAAYFVHEMYHAQRHNQDPSHDDPTKSEMDKFVNTMVQEEADGMILAIESKIDSGASASSVPGESEYRSAFEYVRKEALGKGLDPQEAIRLGKERGRKMINYLIRPGDGSWPKLAPNTFESYEMYYQREWKRSNKPKAP